MDDVGGKDRPRASRGRRLAVGLLLVFAGCLAGLLVMEAVVRAFADRFEKYTPQYLVIDTDGELFVKSEDPVLLYEMRPNITTEALGRPITTNASGFRDHDFAVPKPDDTVRIVGLGDSIAFGLEVPLEATYQKRIEGTLNARSDGRRYEVLNLAVPGYNMIQYQRNLLRNGLRLDPDLVVVSYFADDFFQPKIPKRLAYWRQLLEVRSHLFKLIRERIRSIGAERSGKPLAQYYSDPIALQEGKRALREIWSLLSQRGVGLEVIVHPILEPEYFELKVHFSQYVRQALQGTGAGFVELFPKYIATGTDIRDFRLAPADFTHPSAEGHRRIADWVLEDWEKRGVLGLPDGAGSSNAGAAAD